MGIYKTLSEGLDEVDVIIAGGGSAACVIAARLADADPNLSILVIERGEDNYDNPSIRTPIMFGTHFAPGSKATIFYQANKSDELGGRASVVSSGGCLGGGSSINLMVYARGHRDDFDSWKTPGWTADELVPFLKKIETYHGPLGTSHGSQGPIQVSDGTYRNKRVEDLFLAAAAAVGWPEIPDLQALDYNNGFARYKRYVTPEGKRSDAAHMYLHPRLRDGKHPNLHVLVEAQVIRVLFEGKRACGVEYRLNPIFQGQDAASKKRTVRARRLVVVSSGACGTPSVLERSGIGRADILKKAGVPLVEDLPGVGENYADHHSTSWPFKMSLEPHETLDEILSGRLSLEEAVRRNDERVGWNSIDIGGKLRPTEAEALALGPEFKQAWDRDFRDKPNRPLAISVLANMAFAPGGTGHTEGQYLTWGVMTPYPYSRGHLHITGPGVDDPLDFDIGFFTDEGNVDVKKQIWSYKKGREIMRRLPTYRGEHAYSHPPFAVDSKAACISVDGEWDVSAVKDLEYTAEDDKVLEEFIRGSVVTTWHSQGTAKMAPRGELGVVDKDLSVYGVLGLKVADMSIPPQNVAANTMNTALLVGEKAADIIIRELQL
ncbi:GMC oxidoreductase [Xylaria sp. CBS 124048]|nr:GMC oxidoreductase [Xylaria sp. CBS 124048]